MQARSRPWVAPNEEVTADEGVASMISGVVTEYEGRAGIEATCARDADKLECLIQAIEYRDQGNQNTQPWIDTSLAQLQTASAKSRADEALRSGSLDWLKRALSGGDE